MAKSEKLKLLVVDDERSVSELITTLMSDSFDVLSALSGEQAIEIIKEHGHEICSIISDYKMTGMNGFELREQLPEAHKDIPFILISAFISKEDALAALDAKVAAFLAKPFESNESIVSTIKKFACDRESSIRERSILEQIFIEEASNIVEELEPLIMSLEQKPNNIETLNTIFRLVHTIKGSSGVLESVHIRTYVHKYEDLLSKLKNGVLVATPEIVSILLAGFDIVGQMITALRHKKPWTKDVTELARIFDISKATTAQVQSEVSQQEVSANKVESAKENVNVPAVMLDEFMELSGEITVIRNMVNKLVRVIEKETPGNKNVLHLSELLDEMHKINSGMQGRLVETRKVPLGKVFRPLPRTVRDTARNLGKSINLKIEGDQIRVDTALAQALTDSLIHIVRNSIDHGIESKAKRLERQKNSEGEIFIRAQEKGEEIVITIADDGGGLDTDRIKKKAVERGLYSSQDIEGLSRQKVFSLIFESGFSTAQQVTDVSGRGVGMDMVRSSIQKVKGRIEIESELGKGTTFSLHMPIPKSVLIINSLLVDAAGSTFALPQNSIARLIRLEGNRVVQFIKPLEGAYVFEFDGHLIPMVDLSEILGLRESCAVEFHSRESQNVLVINTESFQFALAVDRILDSEEIVVKSVGKHLEKAKVYAGATFMGDGGVGLILNADGIAERAGLTAGRSIAEADSKKLDARTRAEEQEYLLFDLWCQGSYAVPLGLIHRLEEFPRTSFQTLGERRVLIYREQTVPLIDVSMLLGLTIPDQISMNEQDPVPVFVIMIRNRYVAFVIRQVKDVCVGPLAVDTTVKDRPEILGCIDINRRIISVLDVEAVLDRAGMLKALDPEDRLRSFSYGPGKPTELPPQKSVKEALAVADTMPVPAAAAGFTGDGWGVF